MRRSALPFTILLVVVALFCCLLGTRKPRHATLSPADSTCYPMTITDVRGKQITLAHQPLRIISLAPSVTETLFAVGAGARVIADTQYCTYPPAAIKLPHIGGFADTDVEKVVALKPDLVVSAKGNTLDVLDHLAQLGIPVLTVDPQSLEEVDGAIRLIGRATGDAAAAARVAQQCAQRRAAVARRLQTLATGARPRTLLLLSPDGLYSAGPGGHLDDMIRLAGGVNIAAHAKTPWPELSMESVITANPQIIFFLSSPAGTKGQQTAASVLVRWRADRNWRGLQAVQQGRVVALDEDILSEPGPRLIDGLETMAAAMHPEAK